MLSRFSANVAMLHASRRRLRREDYFFRRERESSLVAGVSKDSRAIVVERREHDRHEENGTHARRDSTRFLSIPETHRGNGSRCNRSIFTWFVSASREVLCATNASACH
mmetsp:Transcript_6301/g.25176  ORF Transcript_6301/g.25176 Transcript_6301/m.25176 type:complete len:109 (+) Transcript_6301:5134-5460(+)